MKNIILCGFMGAGKSTVGKALATRLNRQFIDMDDYIEAREKMKIPVIFENLGEEYFRKAEHEAVLALAAMSGLVVASGGGALTRPENVQAFQRDCVIVYLNADFELCYSRIADSDRPLVQKKSREQLEQLYHERAAVYRRAVGIEIEACEGAEEIAAKIIRKVAALYNADTDYVLGQTDQKEA